MSVKKEDRWQTVEAVKKFENGYRARVIKMADDWDAIVSKVKNEEYSLIFHTKSPTEKKAKLAARRFIEAHRKEEQ